MVNTLYLPELQEMLVEQDSHGLREFCTAIHPAQTAEFMEGLSAREAWAVLQYAETPLREEIFSYLDVPKQIAILESIQRPQAATLLGRLAPDDRVDLLQGLDRQLAVQLVHELAPADRRDVLRLIGYPEDTAGAMMTTAFAALREDVSAGRALEEIARQAAKLETIYYIYVVDDGGRLRGVLSVRQLLRAMRHPEIPMGELMEGEVVTVNVWDNRETVAHKVARFDLLAIPVVDDQRHLLGIITHDDVIDTVVEEATEDAHRMGGMMPIPENFLEARFVSVWWRRAAWLSTLFLAELLTFTALARFEQAIAAVIALSLFVPLCISTGGNSGSQAATLITRALALEQVALRDWLRVLRHEVLMGAALGLTLGMIGFVRASLTPQSVLGNADRWRLALTVAAAVSAICLWGTTIGAMLPLIFKRLGVDPAFASSPFVATFVDVTGIVIYFSIARVLLF